MFMLAMVSMIAISAFAEEEKSIEALPTDAQVLDQQMRDLLMEREAVLTQMAEDMKTAPLDERTARDAEYADMQTQYEIQLLEMMVEYYEVTGNEQLRLRAEANLAQMLAPAATGTPEAVNGEGR